MATNKFDPTQYGATEFNPLELGATPFDESQTGINPETAPVESDKGFIANLADKTFQGGIDVATGFVKGAASTLATVPKAVATIFETTAKIQQSKAVENGIRQIGAIADRQAQVLAQLPEGDPRRETAKAALISAATQIDLLAKQNPDSNDSATAQIFQALNPTNTAQKIGFGAEKLTEAVLMGKGGFNQARSAIAGSTIEGASSSKLLNTAINVAGGVSKTAAKAAVSAGESALLTAAQGGKPEDIKKAAKLGFAVQVGTDTLTAVTKASGSFLINKAKGIYQRVLRPSTTLGPQGVDNVVKTGLTEAIVLSENGLVKTANRIDDLENQLGRVIEEAGAEGGTVKTAILKPYVDEVKVMADNITDVEKGERLIKEIDDLYNNFAKKYGDDIPVARAQIIKTNTYKWLKEAYGALADPMKEANKQMARGLKEGILVVAPEVGDINQRLGKLYEFDKALEKASVRLGNKNVLSLGTKVLGAAALGTGKGTLALAIAAVDALLTGNPTVKSWSAIQMNRIGNMLAKLNPEEKKAIMAAYPALKQLIVGGATGTLTKQK